MKKALMLTCIVALLAACATTDKKDDGAAFFPALPQPPKLQYLTSISTEEDLGGKSSSGLKEWVIGQRVSRKQIARPQDIAASNGRIYLLDRTYKAVLSVDLAGKSLNFLKAEREGALGDPMGLWVTPDDYKYVADVQRKQVVVFGPDNAFVRAYGEEDQFERPMDVAVFQNRVYVVDFTRMTLEVLDRDSGKTLQTIGKPGQEEGEFNRPTHVTVDAQGNVYVNDSFNYRIQKFSPEGEYLKHYGYQGDTLGGFARPKGIAVDRGGYVYAVDAAFENAQIFDPESTDLLLFFGGYGPHAGSMYLPGGLHIDYDNIEFFRPYIDKDFEVEYLVYVGNLLGDHKLNVYGFGHWIGPPLPKFEGKTLSPE